MLDINDKWLNVTKRIALAQTDFAEIVVSEPYDKGDRVGRYEVDHDLDTLLWCGPAVISALTGEPTSRIRDIIRRHRKEPKSQVMGTSDEDLQYCFRRLGYNMKLTHFWHSTDPRQHPTTARWLRENTRIPYIAYILNQLPTPREKAGHWATVLGKQYICTQTSAEWIPIEAGVPTARSRLSSVFTISSA